MFNIIEGLPADVMAIEATGKVTHADYRDTLIPMAEAMMAQGPVKMLYVIGQDCTGFELEARWDDGTFGIKHWHDFSHIAVASDRAWLNAMVSMFKPLFHGDVRLFKLAELPVAKDWINSTSERATS
ncbi:STAS/SEC14 domain-containing protein [Rugamonas sp. CCM 8940]|uniref:STAS/SEC14 domain-containing protein n=1 Tax=Rugamonas sp. CCM 8940 TaxID=2765359 RepID=UPI0018F4A39C|nr:STAS/SEC14 domain-containing protein [Rugamonas sp. CCM 8940]MBJ7309056.1 STAS/SEC14 domain-containing protein [Rugamonas sp. CCM 8940]